MHDSINLTREALEILQTVENIKGPIHARMVLSIFSMNNCFTVALNLATMPNKAKEAMMDSWENIVSQTIHCYSIATLKQDSNWIKYSEEERADKAGRFIKSLQEDVETLERKQQEYNQS